jgi:hypothetical protein
MHTVALNLSTVANDLETEADYLVTFEIIPFLQSIQADTSRLEMWRDVEFFIRWPLEKDLPAQARKVGLETVATRSVYLSFYVSCWSVAHDSNSFLSERRQSSSSREIISRQDGLLRGRVFSITLSMHSTCFEICWRR